MSSCKSVLGRVYMIGSKISGFGVHTQLQVQHFLVSESLLTAVD